MKKIGILGGTFNPIHKGHIHIAKSALNEYGLDEIWFIPNGCPPHKNISNKISAISRYNMVEATIEEYDRFRINDIEILSCDYNYTHETLMKLKKKYPNNEYYFIIGEDSLDSFEKWKNPSDICKYAKILVATRRNYKYKKNNEEYYNSYFNDNELSLKDKIVYNNKRFNGDFLPLNCDYYDISSSEIRNLLYNNLDLSEVLEEKTINYINQHFLYKDKQTMGMKSIEEIKEDLAIILKPSRYEHTLGVKYTAENLSMKYDIPLDLAGTAGILHDCAKYMSDDELMNYCKLHEIEVTKAEELAPHLLHAKVGANIAKIKYNVTNEDILKAIIHHTTGRPNMSMLEQIIFVADYIEPNRDMAVRLDEIRAIAYVDLNIATTMILQDTISYLKEKEANIDKTTIDTYEYYKKLLEN